jgi:hypothetical protein
VAADPSLKRHFIDVLLVPQSPASAGPVLVTAFGPPDGSGPFDFLEEGLAPGNYLAYAFADIRGVEYRNSEFLRGLSGGLSVQVEDGSTRDLTIADVIR